MVLVLVVCLCPSSVHVVTTFFLVKIVINDNIIEQVTDFKYLGYRISEYGSDLEDKLQPLSYVLIILYDVGPN